MSDRFVSLELIDPSPFAHLSGWRIHPQTGSVTAALPCALDAPSGLAPEYGLGEIDYRRMGPEGFYGIGKIPPAREGQSEFVDSGVESRLCGNPVVPEDLRLGNELSEPRGVRIDQEAVGVRLGDQVAHGVVQSIEPGFDPPDSRFGVDLGHHLPVLGLDDLSRHHDLHPSAKHGHPEHAPDGEERRYENV